MLRFWKLRPADFKDQEYLTLTNCGNSVSVSFCRLCTRSRIRFSAAASVFRRGRNARTVTHNVLWGLVEERYTPLDSCVRCERWGNFSHCSQSRPAKILRHVRMKDVDMRHVIGCKIKSHTVMSQSMTQLLRRQYLPPKERSDTFLQPTTTARHLRSRLSTSRTGSTNVRKLCVI